MHLEKLTDSNAFSGYFIVFLERRFRRFVDGILYAIFIKMIHGALERALVQELISLSNSQVYASMCLCSLRVACSSHAFFMIGSACFKSIPRRWMDDGEIEKVP